MTSIANRLILKGLGGICSFRATNGLETGKPEIPTSRSPVSLRLYGCLTQPDISDIFIFSENKLTLPPPDMFIFFEKWKAAADRAATKEVADILRKRRADCQRARILNSILDGYLLQHNPPFLK